MASSVIRKMGLESQGLEPAFLIAGVLVLASIFAPPLLKTLRSRWLLSRYPFVNPTWDAANKKRFTESASSIIQEGVVMAKGGPFRINDRAVSRLILPPKYIDEYKNDERLDFNSFVAKELFSNYPGFDPFRAGTAHTMIFQDAVRSQLTQVLSLTIEPMARELPNTLMMVYGKADEWQEAVLTPAILKCVARLTSLIFLGEKFMNNPDWQRISVMYTVDAFIAAKELNTWPTLLRPVVHWFLPQCQKIRRELKLAKELITPEVQRRLNELAENGGKPRRRILDSVDWFVASAKGKPFNYASAEISLAAASIHTTTNTLGFAMADLVENPQYIQPLRDEIAAVLEDNKKLDKNALFKMRLMDSFLKESMRLHPHSAANMPRLATKEITLSDGTVIPKDTYSMIAPVPMSNPALYPNPEKFDGYRFLRLREKPGNENKYQFVTTSTEMTVFGHGVHACPGRFFASNEIKLLLMYMIMHYDWKLPDGQEKVRHVINGLGRTPNPQQKFLYRQRDPELDLAVYV